MSQLLNYSIRIKYAYAILAILASLPYSYYLLFVQRNARNTQYILARYSVIQVRRAEVTYRLYIIF